MEGEGEEEEEGEQEEQEEKGIFLVALDVDSHISGMSVVVVLQVIF